MDEADSEDLPHQEELVIAIDDLQVPLNSRLIGVCKKLQLLVSYKDLPIKVFVVIYAEIDSCYVDNDVRDKGNGRQHLLASLIVIHG